MHSIERFESWEILPEINIKIESSCHSLKNEFVCKYISYVF